MNLGEERRLTRSIQPEKNSREIKRKMKKRRVDVSLGLFFSDFQYPSSILGF